MNQRKPMKRTAFRREGPTVKPAREWTGEYRAERPVARMDRCDGKVRAVPKSKPGRNPALLEMAMGRRCLLLAVENCEGFSGATTVACHQNEGKGMGQKRPDAYSVWGCWQCHCWYDRSSSPRAEKRRAFNAAHLRQIEVWQALAEDQSEPARFRKAARWALSEFNQSIVA